VRSGVAIGGTVSFRHLASSTLRAPRTVRREGRRARAAGEVERAMDAFELLGLSSVRAASGRLYHEFLRVPDLSVGLYELPAGGTDPQSPHTEDELYHIVSGRAIIRVGEEDRPVGPGSVVFVSAGIPHRFHSIEDDLTILVVFGPAEGTRA
jgi:mannose-6-phosphate isomerase-like protein (cupin superfamily)